MSTIEHGENKNTETALSIEPQQEASEIDLVELFYVLLSKLKWIILSVVMCMLIAGGYAFFIAKPQYEATSSLYVLSSNDSIVNLSDFQIGNYLAADYLEVFDTWEVNAKVISDLGLSYSYTQLKNMVSVTNPSNTRMLNITVTTGDPQLSADIANQMALVVSDYVHDVLATERPSVMSSALVPTKPSSPQKTRLILIGALLGLVLSVGVITLRFVLDDKIKSVDDIVKYTGIPVLAVMPLYSQNITQSSRRGERKN